jgi:diketogulonate reductase-like aldo/keto reductase
MSTGNLKRHDVFVTSKLATADQGYENAKRAVQASLQRLGLEYIDLYLIHWPGTAKLDPADPQNALNRRESWRALEEMLEQGHIRAIGVSNYLERHLVEMKTYAKHMPAVNQFELHPAYVPEATISFCEAQGIFVQAYSSLGEGKLLASDFLERHPRFTEIAKGHNVSVARVLLKWALQHNWGVIPKSVRRERILDNFDMDSFALSAEEMAFLDTFHLHETFKTCWDPETIR